MIPAVQPRLRNSSTSHDYRDLVVLFERCFAADFNTRLVAGGAEPEYLPAGPAVSHARIVFTHDYYASALHEIAHWCVAGAERRTQHDYGYWYAPDGRTVEQQRAFEQVEVKPQALEWVFSEAARFRFRVSVDNLDQGLGASESFRHAIAAQARAYLTRGLPARARSFADALQGFYGGSLAIEQFDHPPE